MSITEKIISGKCLTEEEVKDIVTQATCIDDLALVEENERDTARWTQDIQTILSYKGHFYALTWQRGLTEMQENYYEPQVAQKVKKVDKIVKVTEWVNL
jgi:hypothetical protein